MTDLLERARKARHTPAAHGEDIDPQCFAEGPAHPSIDDFGGLTTAQRQAALRVGIEASPFLAGSAFLLDRSTVYAQVAREWADLVQLLPLERARAEVPGFDAWAFQAVQVDTDRYTAEAALAPTGGFFLRVRAGAKVDFPFQTCFLLEREASRQVVHNIIVLDEGAELRLLTGCAAPGSTHAGLHVGVTEVYLDRGATLAETMLHHWSPGFHVRSRTGVEVGPSATYVSNYVLLEPARSVQSRTEVRLAGEGARTELNAIVVGREAAQVDLDSQVFLEAAGTRAESVSRALASDRSRITTRAELLAHHDDSRGHIECRGMALSDEAEVRSVPALDADHAPGAALSHEASVGPIDAAAVDYLTTRGLSSDEAIATLTRGFLRLHLPGLPEELAATIRALVASTAEDAM